MKYIIYLFKNFGEFHPLLQLSIYLFFITVSLLVLVAIKKPELF